MNKTTRVFFGTLFAAVALAIGNVIARQPATDVDGGEKAGRSAVLETMSSADDRTVAGLDEVRYNASLGGAADGYKRLDRMAYKMAYNPATRLPVWVAWHLTAAHTEGKYKREGMKFAEDEDVAPPRATNMDYINSGYDRGHMCPAGDNKWSRQALEESFLYTNCCPQLHNLNAGDWKELEERCRLWAKAYGDIYIVCGPVLLNKKHKKIGNNKVVVPEAYYKVVLRMGREPQAIGFIYRNEAGNKTMASYVNSVDDVERITGLDFFAALPDDVEEIVEATADIGNWE